MKEYLSSLIREYGKVKEMTEEEVLLEYDDNKDLVLASYEKEIDEFEQSENSEVPRMVYDVDIAFSSWESVNSMFV